MVTTVDLLSGPGRRFVFRGKKLCVAKLTATVMKCLGGAEAKASPSIGLIHKAESFGGPQHVPMCIGSSRQVPRLHDDDAATAIGERDLRARRYVPPRLVRSRLPMNAEPQR